MCNKLLHFMKFWQRCTILVPSHNSGNVAGFWPCSRFWLHFVILAMSCHSGHVVRIFWLGHVILETSCDSGHVERFWPYAVLAMLCNNGNGNIMHFWQHRSLATSSNYGYAVQFFPCHPILTTSCLFEVPKWPNTMINKVSRPHSNSDL